MMIAGRNSTLTSSSPFASMGPELLAAGLLPEDENKQSPVEDEPVDVLEDFGETGVYEDDADLDPLSAMEKYCRSELPQQRLAYGAGLGVAVESMQPHEVSGTIISLLRELLTDVYADVRLTALQQVLPVAQRLRSCGVLYERDIETLWDLVQKLLLDADVENQEAASAVLAELSHVLAKGNAVVASQKLVLAVQKLQRLPTDLQAEGALASLRLIAEVVAPHEGSPLTFATIEEFSVGTFKSMLGPDASSDVRQAVALLLPRFARHMPPALRASLLPGWVKTLATDSHWNVRAEVPQLLVNLLSPYDPNPHQNHQQQQQHEVGFGASDASGSSSSSRSDSDRLTLVGGHAAIHKWWKVRAGPTAAAAGSVADSWGVDDLRLLCDLADKLCKDTSLQVKVAALASLGQLLPLLPATLLTSHRPPLLAHFTSTAKPQAQLAGVKVPLALCAPRLSGHVSAMRHRQRQQRRQQQREVEAREQSYQQAVQELVQQANAVVESELQKVDADDGPAAAAVVAAAGDKAAAASSSSSSSSSTSGSGAAAAAGGTGQEGQEQWLLGTANDTPVGLDDAESTAAGGTSAGSSSGAAGGQQLQQQKPPQAAAGTAGTELPCACALHIGKVALHAGPTCWQQLQGAFLELAAAAVHGNCNVAAALLLAFPDLSAALGHQEAATILVPVVLELLHTQLDALTPVLSVMLLDIVSALAPELRICLLQMLPSMALQIDAELAGDWRARLAVARQLSAVVALVSSAQAAYCLWPLLLALVRDPVFGVRAAAAEQAGPLLVQLPEKELPPEQGDQEKAAAAAAALTAAQQDLHDTNSAPAGESIAAEVAAVRSGREDTADVDAAEHAIAAAVAAHAVNAGSIDTNSGSGDEQQLDSLMLPPAPQQQQQPEQQQAADSGSGQRLRWVRRGLSSGLSQLQQQVGKVMESSSVQSALNGVDQQLTWLQQHPQGKVLWDIGSKLVRGGAEQQAPEEQVTIDDLRRQLTSLQVMESAQMDPCKFLATPAWHLLAADLMPLASSKSCSERLVFVVAAGSILAAHAQRQQQQELQQAGELYLQQLLLQLQKLAADPAPGVRCAVAAVASKLLSQGAYHNMGSIRRNSDGSMASSPGVNTTAAHDSVVTGCSAGGFSSDTSSGTLALPSTASAVLQDCLQRLQRDACVSVAEAAKAEGSLCGSAEGDAGAAVAAAAAADAAGLASTQAAAVVSADAETRPQAAAEAADLL